MASRPDLQKLLESICNNVYFQPPESVIMKYPAIVYSLTNVKPTFANDKIYNKSTVYKLTVIDKNPDSSIVEWVSQLPLCKFERFYTSDDLNHTTFIIHF